MTWWLWCLVGLYGVGFCFTFWLNTSMGMITFGLTLMRSVLWPLWIFSGGRLLRGESIDPGDGL